MRRILIQWFWCEHFLFDEKSSEQKKGGKTSQVNFSGPRKNICTLWHYFQLLLNSTFPNKTNNQCSNPVKAQLNLGIPGTTLPGP